jgi:hypothetical protein
MPVHKSDAGWRRMNARVRSGQPVRVARMEHRVRSAAKPKADQPLVAQLEPEVTSEFEAVSFCGDCDGPCTCS